MKSLGNDSLSELETGHKAVDIYRDSLGRKQFRLCKMTLIKPEPKDTSDLGNNVKKLELQEEVLSINEEIYGKYGFANIVILNNIDHIIILKLSNLIAHSSLSYYLNRN